MLKLNFTKKEESAETYITKRAKTLQVLVNGGANKEEFCAFLNSIYEDGFEDGLNEGINTADEVCENGASL